MPLIIEKERARVDEILPVELRQLSAQLDAELPEYPVPSLDRVKNTVLETAAASLTKEAHDRFRRSFTALESELVHRFDAATLQLKAEPSGHSPNWATSRFISVLLAIRTALCETSLTFVMKAPSLVQSTSTAFLLRALAEMYISPATLDVIGSCGSGKRFETKQLSDMFATTRLPGIKSDEFRSYPAARHVVVWRQGHAYKVDILNAQRRPVDASALAAQIHQILDNAHEPTTYRTVALMSTHLGRQQWAKERETVLKLSLNSIEMVESAISTIALHATNPESQHEQLKMTRGDAQNVYSDKTLGFSVFPNGGLAGRADHAAVDGGVIFRFLGVLHELMAKVLTTLDASHHAPCPQEFTFEGHPDSVQSCETNLKKIFETFDMARSPDVLELLRSTNLLNITFQLAFQAAHSTIVGGTSHLLVEPLSVRAFRDGRCDPGYVLTEASTAMFKALTDAEPIERLFEKFAASISAYRIVVRETREGRGAGPGVAVLREIVTQLPDTEDKTIVLDVLQVFQKPSAYFGGVPAAHFIDAVEANVFGPDQLALTYLGKTDRITLCMAGTGKFASQLKLVHHLMIKYLEPLGTMAVAIASAETMYPSRGLSHLASFAHEGQKAQDKGSVVVHAGAGEEYGLAPHERKLVELILAVVVSVARQEIAAGQPAVDVAQNCVVALENCVFFNAGKGAVLNSAGEHELEASIVDGNTGSAGAVACSKRVRNPVLAARLVMDGVCTDHAMLTGETVDRLAADYGIPAVPNSYFSSHARSWQLKTVRNVTDVVSRHRKHPQTVGAAVLDGSGKLAVASSTGGVVNKSPGRIGDTAIVGAGVFADRNVAVACSGQGDAFLKATIASRIAFGPASKDLKAMETVLEDLHRQTGADGAVVSVDQTGKVRIAQTSGSFFVASSEPGKPICSKVVVRNPTHTQPPPFFQDGVVVARLSDKPMTLGDSVVRVKAGSLNSLTANQFKETLLSIKQAATILKAGTSVHRVALVTTSDSDIRLIPLHGLSDQWQNVLHSEEEYHEHYPGYISSKNGPKQSPESLEELQLRIAHLHPPEMDNTFIGEEGKDNLFAKIIRGEIEQWRVWESANHVAFLTPFGNTPGYTVLVPRKHLSSDLLSIADTDLYDLAGAIYDVSKTIERTLGVRRVGIIFEGMEIDYAHAKLIPIHEDKDITGRVSEEPLQDKYCGSVSSKVGPKVTLDSLELLTATLVTVGNNVKTMLPERTWSDSGSHYLQALKSSWYRGLFHVLDTLFHGTAQYFNEKVSYKYAITPITTDCISSPMGLGSDSMPVSVDLLGQQTYVADSMQFTLEYLLRFDTDTPGMYYISPSFRGEDPDSTHLNQFFHVECELRGSMDDAMKTAEQYIYDLTAAMYEKHKDVISRMAGSTDHVRQLLDTFDAQKGFPRVPLDRAIAELSETAAVAMWEYVQDGRPELGRKLTRAGERKLIERYASCVWLTEMDHLSVPFYQAFLEGSSKSKAKAADLLMGLGETLGLGERHATAEKAAEALALHSVPNDTYKWYMDIRQEQAIQTSGWGMGSERYLCWLLQHDDVRDMTLIPRLKGQRFLP